MGNRCALSCVIFVSSIKLLLVSSLLASTPLSPPIHTEYDYVQNRCALKVIQVLLAPNLGVLFSRGNQMWTGGQRLLMLIQPLNSKCAFLPSTFLVISCLTGAAFHKYYYRTVHFS